MTVKELEERLMEMRKKWGDDFDDYTVYFAGHPGERGCTIGADEIEVEVYSPVGFGVWIIL